MTLLTAQPLATAVTRTYNVEVPATPPQATVPAIVVFHGGGQDAADIARRWGVRPAAAVPVPLRNYLLVFPETHPQLDKEWVHFQPGNSALRAARCRRRRRHRCSPARHGWSGLSAPVHPARGRARRDAAVLHPP